MNKLTNKRDIRLLTVLGFAVYFASYLTRINFAAIISEFIRAEGVSRPAASIITTTTFITYGLGQLLSGYLGDKISPRMLIFSGFAVTIAMNLLFPFFTPNIAALSVIWGINGLAQAFMWPPLVKILTSALTDSDYDKCISKVILSSGFGTVTVYLSAPLIIKLLGWKFVFAFSSIFTLIIAILWLLITSRLLKGITIITPKTPEKIMENHAITKRETAIYNAAKILLPIILLTNAVQGVLRDGISTWMPSFISDTFSLDSAVSILTGVALPIFHIICNLLTVKALRLLKNDVFLSIAVFCGLAALTLTMLYIFGTSAMLAGLILTALAVGFVHGINVLQTCYIPIFFKPSGKMSLMAGVINFGVYIGSAASSYMFAVISEKNGWNATIISWIIFALIALGLTLICLLKMKHTIKNCKE